MDESCLSLLTSGGVEQKAILIYLQVLMHNALVGFRETTQGPSWGYLKVIFSETLSTFGDKRPRNGSKNGLRAPRTGMGCPHIGVCVDPCKGPRSALRIQHCTEESLLSLIHI